MIRRTGSQEGAFSRLRKPPHIHHNTLANHNTDRQRGRVSRGCCGGRGGYAYIHIPPWGTTSSLEMEQRCDAWKNSVTRRRCDRSFERAPSEGSCWFARRGHLAPASRQTRRDARGHCRDHHREEGAQDAAADAARQARAAAAHVAGGRSEVVRSLVVCWRRRFRRWQVNCHVSLCVVCCRRSSRRCARRCRR